MTDTSEPLSWLEAILRTIEYYLVPKPRSHGSTFSALVAGWVLARGNRDQALEYFERALQRDVADVQGGTTPRRSTSRPSPGG